MPQIPVASERGGRHAPAVSRRSGQHGRFADPWAPEWKTSSLPRMTGGVEAPSDEPSLPGVRGSVASLPREYPGDRTTEAARVRQVTLGVVRSSRPPEYLRKA